MHRTGELYGQYRTLEQQKETASLGMWVFLVTEILFFGGVFLAYTINRHAFPTAFGIGGNMLRLMGSHRSVLEQAYALLEQLRIADDALGRIRLGELRWQL